MDGQGSDLQLALAAAVEHHPEDSTYVESLLGVAMAGQGVPLPLKDTVQAVERAGCLHAGVRQVMPENLNLLDSTKLTTMNSELATSSLQRSGFVQAMYGLGWNMLYCSICCVETAHCCLMQGSTFRPH